jgi:hypothetical protein
VCPAELESRGSLRVTADEDLLAEHRPHNGQIMTAQKIE